MIVKHSWKWALPHYCLWSKRCSLCPHHWRIPQEKNLTGVCIPDNLDQLAHVYVVWDQELGLIKNRKLFFALVTFHDHLTDIQSWKMYTDRMCDHCVIVNACTYRDLVGVLFSDLLDFFASFSWWPHFRHNTISTTIRRIHFVALFSSLTSEIFQVYVREVCLFVFFTPPPPSNHHPKLPRARLDYSTRLTAPLMRL